MLELEALRKNRSHAPNLGSIPSRAAHAASSTCLSSQCIQVKCHWVPRQSVASVNAAFATCRGTARVHSYGTRHFSQHSGYDPGNPAIIPFSSLPETVRITGTRCPHRTVNHQTASKQRRDFCSVTTEWSLFDNHRVVGASPGADTTTTDWSRRDLPPRSSSSSRPTSAKGKPNTLSVAQPRNSSSSSSASTRFKFRTRFLHRRDAINSVHPRDAINSPLETVAAEQQRKLIRNITQTGANSSRES